MRTTKEIAVAEPEEIQETGSGRREPEEDRAILAAAMKRIEEWGRFNDSHIRRIAIDALVAVGEREQ